MLIRAVSSITSFARHNSVCMCGNMACSVWPFPGCTVDALGIAGSEDAAWSRATYLSLGCFLLFMLLHTLQLNNIRSYVEESVSFPEGSTLLIGDIGSGKSSILLAIEFALFGTRRSELDASSLLRNGAATGSVTLSATIDGKKVVIRRNLKRGKNSIAQGAGYLVVEDKKQEGTATELKSALLSMLGYPEDLLTKSKSLLYRYTVYTPQEDMKRILFDPVEERINVLRKIFNIDKYKRVKENLQLFLRECRSTRRVLEAKAEGLEQDKQRLTELEAERTRLEAQQAKEQPVLDRLTVRLNEQQEQLDVLEKALRHNEELKKGVQLNEQKQQHRQDLLRQNRQRIEQLLQEQQRLVHTLEANQEDIDLDQYREKLSAALTTVEQKKEALLKTITTQEARIQQAQSTVKAVSDLDTCPVCFQKVDDDHKHGIQAKQQSLIAAARAAKEQHQEELGQVQQKLSGLKQNEQNLAKIALRLKERELAKKQVEEKKRQQRQLEKENQDHQDVLKELQRQHAQQQKLVKVEKEDSITVFKQKLEALRKEHHELAVRMAELKQALAFNAKQRGEGKKALLEKETYHKKMHELSRYHDWLQEYLLTVLDLIEKNVFVSIHRDFDETFREWFSRIIDDETLEVRLDETFTPVVEQNGYETVVDHLSGGEKTAVALAYRLALNKVINEFIGTIKTNDLIILDEPTDGFSAEQLDRMREVLDRLNMKQTLIVSHEAKMESYVEHVLRVEKHSHTSKIS